MQLDVILEDPRWQELDLQTLGRRACVAVAAHQELPQGCEVSLMGCDDARIMDLNGEFRDKMRATNVLSWPSEERGAAIDGARPLRPDGPDPDLELGDIAISYETCLREAAEQGKRIDDHVTHLLVHACLHLLGYDHIRPLDAELMEGIEVEILASLDIEDPYEDSGA